MNPNDHTTNLEVEVNNLRGIDGQVYLQLCRYANNCRVVVGRSQAIDVSQEKVFSLSVADSHLINNIKTGEILLELFRENPEGRDAYICHCPVRND